MSDITLDTKSGPITWVAATAPGLQPACIPVKMLLFCPRCFSQHIDDYNGKPHCSHVCHYCEYRWRPSDSCTTGVESLFSGEPEDKSAAPFSTLRWLISLVRSK